MRRLAAHEAREVVSAILTLATSEDPVESPELGGWLVQVHHEDLIPALAEVLGDPVPERRAFAARFMVAGRAAHRSLPVPDSILFEAHSTFQRMLASSDRNEVFIALRMLAGVQPPASFRPLLRKYVLGEHAGMRIMASSVLVACDPEGHAAIDEADLVALRTMQDLLHQTDPHLRVIALSSLGMAGIQLPLVCQAAQILLDTEDQSVITQLLRAMMTWKSLPSPIVEGLAEYMLSEETPDPLCSVAATVLAKDKEAARNVLVKCLRSAHLWRLQGAVFGLAQADAFAPVHVQALIEQLDSEDDSIRLYSAEGIAASGTHAVIALEALVRRAERETNEDCLTRLGAAISACGPTGFPSIRAMLVGGNVLQRRAAQTALRQLGESGGDCLLLCLEGDHSQLGICRVLQAGESLGSQVRVAEPFLRKLIELDQDPVVSRQALRTILSNGLQDPATVDGIVRLLSSPFEELAEEAEQALAAIGSSALPSIERARSSAVSPSLERLERLLASSLPLRRSTFGPLQHVDRDVLRRFRLVGRLLQSGRKSYRQMAEVLSGEPEARALGVSSKSLEKAVRAVEGAFGKGPLTTRGNRRRGGLSPTGIDAHAQTEELLRREEAQERVDKRIE